MRAQLQTLVAQIHAAPPQIVYAFAGAGSLALWELHRVPGSSRTLIEAVDCYAPYALADRLGTTPVHAVSLETAQALARWAYARAIQLSTGDIPVLGLGCTAALATDRVRHGADRCMLALCGIEGIHNYALSLSKGRGREEQEGLVAQLVIGALAVACGLRGEVRLELRDDEELALSPE